MARYLEVGTDIAQRVRSGELPAGAELPVIRHNADHYATTSTTIGRAYRYLAAGGVITLGDRRRARICTDGAIAAARLLEPDRVFRLAGSDVPACMVDRRSPLPLWAQIQKDLRRRLARGETRDVFHRRS